MTDREFERQMAYERVLDGLIALRPYDEWSERAVKEESKVLLDDLLDLFALMSEHKHEESDHGY